MAQPVLVNAYPGTKPVKTVATGKLSDIEALPPISSYAFANILRTVDSSREFQLAIHGIEEICAKTRMSLADEYGSHLPPLGEITVASATNPRPQQIRRGMRRALTSVPEASSGSSEGSCKSSKKKGRIFSFGQKRKQEDRPMHRMRIGSMGRYTQAGTTTAMAIEVGSSADHTSSSSGSTVDTVRAGQIPRRMTPSAAMCSLQRLLASSKVVPAG